MNMMSKYQIESHFIRTLSHMLQTRRLVGQWLVWSMRPQQRITVSLCELYAPKGD